MVLTKLLSTVFRAAILCNCGHLEANTLRNLVHVQFASQNTGASAYILISSGNLHLPSSVLLNCHCTNRLGFPHTLLILMQQACMQSVTIFTKLLHAAQASHHRPHNMRGGFVSRSHLLSFCA